MSFPEVYRTEKTSTRIFCFGMLALAAAAACMIFGFYATDKKWDTSKKAILAVWTLGVPCWFAFEYWWIYRKKGNHTREAFETFKHGQELTNRIWLALVAVLSALYFGGEFIKGH